MPEFSGKVAFITGAAHGQGRAVALALARAGADIAALDVARQLAYPGYASARPMSCARSRPRCEGLGRRALTFAADVRDEAAVAQAVQQTAAELGRIDILFNNAGICAYGLAHELTEDGVGCDARHQPQGRLARGPARHPADDRAASAA